MNREEILKTLEEFPYNREEYWIVAGGAMVLYGFREQTGDIDLGCSRSMADRLAADGFPFQKSEDGKRRFRIGEVIEVFEEWLSDTVVSVDGFPVVSVKGLLEMKRELGREKDLKDIELIRKHFAEDH